MMAAKRQKLIKSKKKDKMKFDTVLLIVRFLIRKPLPKSNINLYPIKIKVRNLLIFLRCVRGVLSYTRNPAPIAVRRTVKTTKNVDGVGVVPRAVMVTSAHDNHITPGPTSLLRQKN